MLTNDGKLMPCRQVINKGRLDAWDYILRRLFVLKSTALRKAIVSVSLIINAETLFMMMLRLTNFQIYGPGCS